MDLQPRVTSLTARVESDGVDDLRDPVDGAFAASDIVGTWSKWAFSDL